MNTKVRRPVLRYHGGKWMLAPWIIKHFPEHRIYVEPFGGAASVLMRKQRSYAEVYNDLDDEVVNLFKILRSDDVPRLINVLKKTPFSRSEFENAYIETDDPLECARRLIIRSFMGFGSDGCTARKTGFRANSNRSGTTPAHDWINYAMAVPAMVERLSGCVIECRPAIDVMTQHDEPNTLHYVDPPYVPSTRARAKRKNYRHEMSDDQHIELLQFLTTLKGNVVLSGYPHPKYDEILHDWRRVERNAFADGARKRIEVLWMNFNA